MNFLVTCLFLGFPVRSPVARGQFFLFFKFLKGSWFLKFSFVLNNFTITVRSVLHFRLVQFSTFQTCTVSTFQTRTIFYISDLYIFLHFGLVQFSGTPTSTQKIFSSTKFFIQLYNLENFL